MSTSPDPSSHRAPPTTDLAGETLSVPTEPIYQDARFPSLQEAGEFARRVAKDILGLHTSFTSAQSLGKYCIAQVWVPRELSAGESTSIPGTVLLDSDQKVVGLKFTAHTEECDSGHECCWTEDLTGKVLSFVIEPR